MQTNIFQPLIDTYRQMDRQWDTIAQKYQFKCNGCEDNCCQSLFFHFTHVEKDYLIHGFKQLATDMQTESLKRARHYLNTTFTPDIPPQSKKIMCPVNESGQCLLYQYRPMICRLHGLPHELHRPGSAPVKGPGCYAGNFQEQPYFPFDRTPFYRMMAQIEMEYQTETGKAGKIKQTIAQMLLS